jgi:lysophospholipase L1-like esterase
MIYLRILFQGDSITDAGRDQTDPHNLGNGYARFAAQMLKERYPCIDFEFLNQGIGGHRSGNLRDRWQTDCLDLKADIVSILIGVNDVFGALEAGNPDALNEYEANCLHLFEAARADGAKLLVLEPFLLMNAPDREDRALELAAVLTALRRVSRKLADAYVPLDGLFAAASVAKTPAYWSADGIHPTEEAAWFIARHYVDAMAGLL